MTTKRFIKKPVLLALILILVVGAIYYIESQKPDIQDITQPSTQENQLTEQSPTPTTEKNAPRVSLNAELKKARYKQAPDFRGIEHWINTEPLTINDLKGKVVLVDFWTYSCINCIRTLPYITQWDEKYRDDGNDGKVQPPAHCRSHLHHPRAHTDQRAPDPAGPGAQSPL